MNSGKDGICRNSEGQLMFRLYFQTQTHRNVCSSDHSVAQRGKEAGEKKKKRKGISAPIWRIYENIT